MMETRAAASTDTFRNGLFIGARTPCERIAVPTLMNSAQKKRRATRLGVFWRSWQWRTERSHDRGIFNAAVAPLALAADHLNSDHPP